jgi:aerobic-type carbon monoxide dehydrogenase small subunit (CoxS/CutS family)
MPEYSFKVNGQEQRIEASPDTPLLWILRDTLGLTGTKYGCGAGVCGSCTIHRDGQAVRACSITAAEANGGSFTTIEGLSRDGSHPVQRAWINEDVAQCGYCQPGMIMAAAALLSANPRPTDRDIDLALADMVCRCGTYLRIRRAVRKAAGT